MPIFNYKCLECGRKFEEITGVANEGEVPKCPACSSKNLEKMISNFSVGKSLAKSYAPSCAGPGCPADCPSKGNR